jgi:hypothetical protein
MLFTRPHSSTSNRFRVQLRHATTGAGLTGLSEASAGLVIALTADNEASATTYTQAGGTIETIAALGTFAAPTANKCRFKEFDATNHQGLYEVQFADTRFSVTDAKQLNLSISGAANLLDYEATIQLEPGPADIKAVNGDTNIGSLTDPVASNLMEIGGSATVDGVAIVSLFRAIIAFLCGKLTVTDNGATRTLSFKQQDGATESFTVTVAEADGARANTGSIT